MPGLVANIYRYFRVCPVASLLQLLCLYSFFIMARIAIQQQAGISHTLYILLIAATGLVAIVTLAIHSTCRINSQQDS